jgi:prevent-host-death family protein
MTTKPTETIAISEFKATCLAVLERVRRTGASIVVTRRGEPVAEINPPSPASTGDAWLGAMRDSAVIAGDLVAPASDAADWEALAP